MKRCLVIVCGILIFACSSSTNTASPDAALPDATPPLPPLPAPQPAETDQFVSATFCAQCHLRGSSVTPSMSTAAGDDVSPVEQWRGSMMALAARDPFYLAVFEEEIVANPEKKTEIEALCTRCHAPAGNVASEQGGAKLSFEELTSGNSKNAAIGRDGITCSMCHQIRSIDLGNDSSFTGGFSVGSSRRIYGPHANPRVTPMQMFVRYTPEYAEHIKSSALCATCHTVIVSGPDGQEVVEQAPYLEWLNSSYNNESGQENGISCQECHMPRIDEQGAPIVTAIAKFPEDLSSRDRYSQHTLIGGNSFMLRLMAGFENWVNSGVPAEDLIANAQLSEKYLSESSATLEIVSAERTADSVVIRVAVNNKTGHKLPTGYPTRRVWLHLTARDSGGQVVFESGGYDLDGRIVGVDGEPGIGTHRDEISAGEQVLVWEHVLVDAEGHPTLRALDVAAVAKDNRILPLGWSNSHEQIARIRAVGTDGDSNFIGGSDTITYRFPYAGSTDLDFTAELLYQSVPPKAIDTVSGFRTAASERFVDMARATDNRPIALASADGSIAQ